MDLIKNSRIISAENLDSDATILLENSTTDPSKLGVIFKVNTDVISSKDYTSSFTSEMTRTYTATGITVSNIPTGITYKGVPTTIETVPVYSQIMFTSDISFGGRTYSAPTMFRRMKISNGDDVGRLSVDFQHIGVTPYSADDLVNGVNNKFVTPQELSNLVNALPRSKSIVTSTTSGTLYHDYLMGTIDDGLGGALAPTASSVIIELNNLPSNQSLRVEGEIVLDLYQGQYEYHRDTMRSVIYNFNGYWTGNSWSNIAYGCTSVLHTMRAAHTSQYKPALILDGVFMNGVGVVSRLMISSTITDETSIPELYWKNTADVSNFVTEDIYIASEQVRVSGITVENYVGANGFYQVEYGSGDSRIFKNVQSDYFIWKSTTSDYNMNLSGFPITAVNGTYTYTPGRVWVSDSDPKYTIKLYNDRWRVYDGNTIIYSTHSHDGNPYGTVTDTEKGSWVWCTGDTMSYITGALAVATDSINAGWWVLTSSPTISSSNMVPGMSTVLTGLANPYDENGNSVLWQNNPAQGWGVSNLSVIKFVSELTTANVAHRDDFLPSGDPSYGQLTFEALFPFWNAVGINKTTNVDLPIDNTGSTLLGWSISAYNIDNPVISVDLSHNVTSYVVMLGGGNHDDISFDYTAVNGVPGTNSSVVFYNKNTSGSIVLVSSIDASQTATISPGNILYTTIYTDITGTRTIVCNPGNKHTHDNATSTSDGFMSKEDYNLLHSISDTIDSNINSIVSPDIISIKHTDLFKGKCAIDTDGKRPAGITFDNEPRNITWYGSKGLMLDYSDYDSVFSGEVWFTGSKQDSIVPFKIDCDDVKIEGKTYHSCRIGWGEIGPILTTENYNGATGDYVSESTKLIYGVGVNTTQTSTIDTSLETLSLDYRVPLAHHLQSMLLMMNNYAKTTTNGLSTVANKAFAASLLSTNDMLTGNTTSLTSNPSTDSYGFSAIKVQSRYQSANTINIGNPQFRVLDSGYTFFVLPPYGTSSPSGFLNQYYTGGLRFIRKFNKVTIDGHEYKTCYLGNTWWTAEDDVNERYGMVRVTDTNTPIYGTVYTYENGVAYDNWLKSQGSKFRVPRGDEYLYLSTVGSLTHMQLKKETLWISGAGNNQSGFSATPGGFDRGGVSSNIGTMAYYATTTEASDIKRILLIISATAVAFNSSSTDKTAATAMRLVQRFFDVPLPWGEVRRFVKIGNYFIDTKNFDWEGEDGKLGRFYQDNETIGAIHGRLYNHTEMKYIVSYLRGIGIPLGIPTGADWGRILSYTNGSNGTVAQANVTDFVASGTNKYELGLLRSGRIGGDGSFSYLDGNFCFYWSYADTTNEMRISITDTNFAASFVDHGTDNVYSFPIRLIFEAF